MGKSEGAKKAVKTEAKGAPSAPGTRVSPEQAESRIKRRLRSWKDVKDEKVRVEKRLAAIAADVGVCLEAMGVKAFQAGDVRAQLTPAGGAVKPKDPKNLKLVRKQLTDDEFEAVCPRAISVPKLRTLRPELLKSASLVRGPKSESLRIQVVASALAVGHGGDEACADEASKA